MSVAEYIKRGLKYIIGGVPQKNITANISYLQPNRSLLSKKIIITGGSRGIGKALACKFVSEGAEVLITGRDMTSLMKVSDEIGCKYLVLDLSNISEIDSFIAKANDLLGGIDVLVNNAGVSLHEKSFFDVTSMSFDEQINVNFKAPFFLTQHFVRYLKFKNQQGSVLFISSETGETPDFRPYGYTKAAVNSMARGLASLFAKDGIRVNAVAPGITASEMTSYNSDGNLYCSINSQERVYLPEEMAEVACFLLSEASGCISGQIITCNNARTINARWK